MKNYRTQTYDDFVFTTTTYYTSDASYFYSTFVPSACEIRFFSNDRSNPANSTNVSAPFPLPSSTLNRSRVFLPKRNLTVQTPFQIGGNNSLKAAWNSPNPILRFLLKSKKSNAWDDDDH